MNLGGWFTFPGFSTQPHVAGTLDSTGLLSFGINNISGGILDFNFNNIALSVTGDVSALSGTMTVGGDLGLANFPSYHLGGTFSSGGPINLYYSGGLNLGGFAATSGSISLDRVHGLLATGRFDLSVPGANPGAPVTTFNNNLLFTGNIGWDGSFALTGKDTLSFGGFTTASSTFTLDNSHVSGSTSIHLGLVNTDIGVSVSLDGSGISVSGSGAVDTGWGKVYDWFPGGDSAGDVWARVVGTLSLSSNSTGAISGQFGATFGIWERVNNNPPKDINSADVHFGKTWGVGTDGRFGVDYDFTGVTVDFGQIPPWSFNKKSWGFDLW